MIALIFSYPVIWKRVFDEFVLWQKSFEGRKVRERKIRTTIKCVYLFITFHHNSSHFSHIIKIFPTSHFRNFFCFHSPLCHIWLMTHLNCNELMTVATERETKIEIWQQKNGHKMKKKLGRKLWTKWFIWTQSVNSFFTNYGPFTI
jgi:hypothetical protein